MTFFLFFNVYLYCFIATLFLILFGRLVNLLIFKTTNNIVEDGLIGIIFISFLSLLINFFSSINSNLNSIIFFLIFFVYIFFRIEDIKKVFSYSLIISFIGFFTFILDHSNRPDAGLYHLPYVSILNENKVLIGSVNLHFRFGHTSILQYLQAIFNNKILGENGILIPLTIFYSLTIIFFFKETINQKNKKFLQLFCFLVFIWIIISMNRYSGFGNDDPAHFAYFLLIFYLLKKNFINFTDHFNLIFIFSIFAYMQKQFYILSFIFPLYFLFKNYKKIKIINFGTFFCFLFIFIWLIKNIMISGCVLYPLKISCISQLEWYPLEFVSDPENISKSSEAWAKGFGDRANKQLNYDDYLSNFYWIKIWVSTHLKYILKKTSIILLIFSIIGVYVLIKNISKKIIFQEKKIIFLIISNFVFTVLWFLKFPIYRYGAGYIAIFIIIIFLYLLRKKITNFQFIINKISVFSFVLYICIFSIITKNSIRIYKNYNHIYDEYPWPIKNSFDNKNNKKITSKPIIKNNQILYYMPDVKTDILCMYSISPCTHLGVNVSKKKFFNYYDMFISKKN